VHCLLVPGCDCLFGRPPSDLADGDRSLPHGRHRDRGVTDSHVGFHGKADLLCLVLLVTASISILLLPLDELAVLGIGTATRPAPIDLFVTSMCVTYLLSNIWYIWMLIAPPGRNQSLADRAKEWREDAHLMASRFADDQMRPLEFGLTIAIVGGA
jgi:hypothetical protein